MCKFFILIFLAINIPLFNSQCFSSYELNVDYKGDDLFPDPLFLNTADSCCSLCYNYTSCRAWTFVPDVQACWLKSSSFLLRLISNGRLSGIKPNFSTTTIQVFTTLTSTLSSQSTPTTTIQTPTTTLTTPTTTTPKSYGCFIENGINYYGNDLSGSYVTSASECCNLCGLTTSCVVWSYLVDLKFCYLKNALPSLESRLNYTGIISGIVTLR